jgi:cell division protease FtsH
MLASKNNFKRNIRINTLPSKLIQEVGKNGGKLGEPFSFSELIKNVEADNIRDVSIIENTNTLVAVDKLNGADVQMENLHQVTNIPQYNDFLLNKLYENNVNFDVFSNPQNFLSQIPFPFQILIFYFIFTTIISFIRTRNMSNGINIPGNPLTMFMNNPKLVANVNVTFADVAGIDEAKNELVEIVEFLKDPQKFTDAGAIIPSGALLEGPPGTGKTLLARAVAGEAGVSFLSASGSEFIEMFVGVGASRVRKLFEVAKENKPCVIFIDEIDAIGRQRGAGINGGNDEREQTLNQILTNMDGFEKSDGIVVLAATNRADILDSALTRPGRFDRKVMVSLPDRYGREEIAKIHFRNKNLASDFNYTNIAVLTNGFSGADIANLANEAAIYSVRRNSTNINIKDVMDAFEKTTIGLPNLKETRSDETLKLVAYHEAGHALLVLFFKEFFELQKVTIRANKNGAGGYTLFTPIEKVTEMPSKKYLLANLIISLGGRAAEIILNKKVNNTADNYRDNQIFNNFNNLYITTGATGDLQQVYKMARQYITQYGLGEQLLYESNMGSQPFLGRELATNNNKLSEETIKNIDSAVQELVDFAMSRALYILNENFDDLVNFSTLLIQNKTLSYESILNKFNVNL